MGLGDVARRKYSGGGSSGSGGDPNDPFAGIGSDPDRKPIGVPGDFRVTPPDMQGLWDSAYSDSGNINTGGRPGPAPPAPTLPPRYFIGDELRPPYGSSPEAIVRIQDELQGIGLLKPGSYQRGFWDGDSIKAYETLLAYANISGQTREATLRNYSAIAKKYGLPDTAKNARQRAPLVVELTNPDDLKEVLRNVSAKTIGRELREDEVGNFVTTYHNSQRQQQTDAYNMSDIDASGGTIVAPPDPSVMAEQQVRRDKPGEVASYDAVNRFLQFQELL